jgi:heme-degrading monooxygenase HmoA
MGGILPRPCSHRLRRYGGIAAPYLLRRQRDDGVEFLAVTLWESLKDIEPFAGADVSAAKIAPQAQALLVGFDDFARHFEVSYASGCRVFPP